MVLEAKLLPAIGLHSSCRPGRIVIYILLATCPIADAISKRIKRHLIRAAGNSRGTDVLSEFSVSLLVPNAVFPGVRQRSNLLLRVAAKVSFVICSFFFCLILSDLFERSARHNFPSPQNRRLRNSLPGVSHRLSVR